MRQFAFSRIQEWTDNDLDVERAYCEYVVSNSKGTPETVRESFRRKLVIVELEIERRRKNMMTKLLGYHYDGE